ncbi:hypothetical protein MMC25_004917 [Agyrium rufum]|nr:hypothetical protein [Agyrium rufum]
MYATTTQQEYPPLPTYDLTPLPPLLPPIPDKLLTLLLPIAAYWGLSLLFHWIDTKDYFSQHRLHTPAEVLKRNHVTKWEVVRDVIIQQVVQTAVGWVLGMTEPDDVIGQDGYNVVVWARRIRVAQSLLPGVLSLLGVNAMQLATNVQGKYPGLAGALVGGRYPKLFEVVALSGGNTASIPTFAAWETNLAQAIYWFIVPACQFIVGILIVDTWQYFLHRAMHMNKWLYTTFHSRHHRLYVPYAFGALYNHPVEGFVLDTLGAAIAFKVAGMSTRQGMWFFTGSTIKTVDDHCGYSLPWDPVQHLTSNNAGYHDIHHQSWGIKTNFSQPFFTFWDRLLGTVWTGGDVSARYERAKISAQKKVDAEQSGKESSSITNTSATDSQSQSPKPYENDLKQSVKLRQISETLQQPSAPQGKAALQAAGSREQVLDDSRYGGRSILAEEAQEEKEVRTMLRKSPRKRTTSSFSGTESLKGLSERVAGSMHGRSAGILGMESKR